MTEKHNDISRRTVIRGSGVAVLAGLAGCSGGDGDGNGNSTDGDGTGDGGSMQPVELLHAWSSGDGKDAIRALIEGFQEAHPDVKFAQEPVEGAARGNLDTVIQNRMSANDPPSTWQAWPGKNLLRFEGAYGDIEGSVWTDDLKNNYIEGPQKQAQVGGKYVTVPINIHRINNLFYNKSVVEQAGVDPSSISSPSGLVDAFDAVATETDATPFAQQTSSGWSTVQLWETVLLGEAGQSGYDAFIKGNGNRDQVVSALETVKSYTDYYPDDASSISFTEANKRVMNGSAAFIHQGDWAAGAYTGTDDFNYGEDWGQVTFPGSSGYYQLNMDSFPYPKNNPSPESTKLFLSYCGSTEGQIKFNQKKGSIPPRKDADVSKLNKFQQDQFDDFNSSKAQPPSVQHGLAVRPAIRTNVTSAFSGFIESYDVQSTADKLIEAFQ